MGHVLDMDSEGSAWFRWGTVGVSRLPARAVSGYEGSRKEPGGVELEGREKVRSTLPDRKRPVFKPAGGTGNTEYTSSFLPRNKNSSG